MRKPGCKRSCSPVSFAVQGQSTRVFRPGCSVSFSRTTASTSSTIAVSVHEAFLAEAFAVMTERHGSVDNYLAEVLGVDATLRDAIAARILR